MESCRTDDLEAFISNPNGRRYWTKSRRDVICRIFRQEILDETLSLPIDKVTNAINELGEERNRQMQARIRAFIYRVRRDRLKVLETGNVYSAPKRRKMEKGFVEASIPLPNSSRSTNNDTGSDPVKPPSDEIEIDLENANESECHNEKIVQTDVQQLNEYEESNTLKCGKDERKSDPVDLSLSEKRLDFENNNEASFSPTKKITSCAPEVISAIKNHFAQELSSLYLSPKTVKVDFVTDFLKSRGFDNITRESVFSWANAVSTGDFDHNPVPLFKEVTKCLVHGIIHGEIDLKFILESYTDTSDQFEVSFEKQYDTKETPLETASSILKDEAYNVYDLKTIDLSPIKGEIVDKPISSENENNAGGLEKPNALRMKEEDFAEPISSKNEDVEARKINLRKRKNSH